MILLAEFTTSLIFVVGLALGALANWAIYRLAWNPREISPWGPAPKGAPSRKPADRIPVLGWLGLRREQAIHGPGFWVRPMLLELAMGIGLASLYWWEVSELQLILPQINEIFQGDLRPAASFVSSGFLHSQFISHTLLITLMVAASFIDIDEKIIPDEITVPGTLLGLVLATLLPMSLLPHVGISEVAPMVGEEVQLPAANANMLKPGFKMFVEPTSLVSPNAWPEVLQGKPNWKSLAVGLACWWLWCFAECPRIWRGRHGAGRALVLIVRRVIREITRGLLGIITWVGTALVVAVWWWGGTAWLGLLTSLVGMAVTGGLVWVVRKVGTAALGREAMGFGDVTLMMMIGTFVGWQAGVVIFFVSPLAGLVVGVILLITKSDDVIPYGPFLCLGTLFVIVQWPKVWNIAFQDLIAVGWLVPAVLGVCFTLLGVMLMIWQQIKRMFA